MAKIIAFEGPDMMGKTTLIKKMEALLIDASLKVKIVKESGMKDLFDKKSNQDAYNRTSKAFYKSVNNDDNTVHLIWKLRLEVNLHIKKYWNEQYDVILYDRTYLSTFVYQHNKYAEDVIEHYNNWKSCLCEFDDVIYLEPSDELILKKIESISTDSRDTFEESFNDVEYKRICDHYKEVVTEYIDNPTIFSLTLEEEYVNDKQIKKYIKKLIKK